jgi:type II restriction enzyme
MVTRLEAKERLDLIINKARTDLYKPIQIAEVLRRSRLYADIEIRDLRTFQNPSLRWRDEVTKRLLGKVSTSSARYQHDLWSGSAMPTDLLAILDSENKRTNGGVEKYIYSRFNERQNVVSGIINCLEGSTPQTFQLSSLIEMFNRQKGIKRSIDKAYEIITYALFETVVTILQTTITISIPPSKQELALEFSDLTYILTGIRNQEFSQTFDAHVYRVGVTNAADHGLDMWANFGLAIQVKHLSLDQEQVELAVDQIESDRIVIVCRDVDARAIEMVTKQISWGQRVKGFITESDLIKWYELCLRGKFAVQTGLVLMNNLTTGFKSDFPQVDAFGEFWEERGYAYLSIDSFWE